MALSDSALIRSFTPAPLLKSPFISPLQEGARTGRVTPSPFPNVPDGRPPPAVAQNPAVANLRERAPASRTPPRGQSPTRRGAAPNSGSNSPRGGYEELKRINDSLHQEVVRLNAQVGSKQNSVLMSAGICLLFVAKSGAKTPVIIPL